MMLPGEGHARDNVISLLQCLLEQCPEPRHKKEFCATNDCPRCVFDHYKKELEAPYKPKPSDAKAFPMLDEPRSIPWELGIAIHETLYAPLHHDQTAKRIAERGGFGWEEVKLMARDAKNKGMI